MINFVEGILAEKSTGIAVVNVNGVGYELAINASTFERLCEPNRKVRLYVSESVSMYGGGTVLYGFLTKEEKETFICFKENIPNTGAKKALDYLDKAGKSFPEFEQAVSAGNLDLLVNIFSFTKKTAEKIISSLKGKVSSAGGTGFSGRIPAAASGFYAQIKASLQALGYNSDESDRIIAGFEPEELQKMSVEEFLKQALRKINV